MESNGLGLHDTPSLLTPVFSLSIWPPTPIPIRQSGQHLCLLQGLPHVQGVGPRGSHPSLGTILFSGSDNPNLIVSSRYAAVRMAGTAANAEGDSMFVREFLLHCEIPPSSFFPTPAPSLLAALTSTTPFHGPLCLVRFARRQAMPTPCTCPTRRASLNSIRSRPAPRLPPPFRLATRCQ